MWGRDDVVILLGTSPSAVDQPHRFAIQTLKRRPIIVYDIPDAMVYFDSGTAPISSTGAVRGLVICIAPGRDDDNPEADLAYSLLLCQAAQEAGITFRVVVSFPGMDAKPIDEIFLELAPRFIQVPAEKWYILRNLRAIDAVSDHDFWERIFAGMAEDEPALKAG